MATGARVRTQEEHPAQEDHGHCRRQLGGQNYKETGEDGVAVTGERFEYVRVHGGPATVAEELQQLETGTVK